MLYHRFAIRKYVVRFETIIYRIHSKIFLIIMSKRLQSLPLELRLISRLV